MYSFLDKDIDRVYKHSPHLRAVEERQAFSSALTTRPVYLAVKFLQSIKHPVTDKRGCTACKVLMDPCHWVMLALADII